MTTPEHALVGIHVAFACGLHHYLGWRSVVLSAVASVLPDWDGIPMLVDMQRFEAGHRVWGHNLLAILILAALLAYTQRRWDWMGTLGAWFERTVRIETSLGTATSDGPGLPISLGVLMLIAAVAQGLHLICDMVVSGGPGLTAWAIEPWWPLSCREYVLPLIPWGDVVPTLLLMAGVIIQARRPRYVTRVAMVTLAALCLYAAVRGWYGGISRL